MIANLHGVLECPGAQRNNKFLTSDLDTLLRDAYGRFALRLLLVSPFLVYGRETELIRGREKNRT